MFFLGYWEIWTMLLQGLPFPASMHANITLKQENLNKVYSIHLFYKLS